jgi:benzoyl-CoA 2,3-epoxidase subunit A
MQFIYTVYTLCLFRKNKIKTQIRQEFAMNSALPSEVPEQSEQSSSTGITHQHLIDPQSCFRCSTCENTCPAKAISHRTSYAIQHDLCTNCGECVADCPTGAIDHWVELDSGATPYSVDEQFSWNELPELPDSCLDDLDLPTVGHGHFHHAAVAPASASTPVVNRYDIRAPLTATLVSNQKLTPEGCSSSVHHIVIRSPKGTFPVLEGQTLGVIPPGVDGDGNAHFARAYSVASSRYGDTPESGDIALTVKRVTAADSGAEPGVASNFICDLRVGDSLQLTGPFGTSFLLPEDADSRLLMICTGTGIAPMRGMIQHRLREGIVQAGNMALFYGGRTLDEMAYVEELRQAGDAVELHLALSREADAPKQYVQDLIRSQAERLVSWLQDSQTVIYLCGLISMEEGVEKAFTDICAEQGISWSSLAQQLRAEGRLHIETY